MAILLFHDDDVLLTTEALQIHHSSYDKTAVMNYLLNKDFGILMPVSNDCHRDVLDGTPVQGIGKVCSDGEYTWYDFLADYVLRYDIYLPLEFVTKIESSPSTSDNIAYDWTKYDPSIRFPNVETKTTDLIIDENGNTRAIPRS